MKRPGQFVGLALGLALVACGGVGSPGGGSSGLPADAPVALVDGPVQSPLFEELKKDVRMVQYDGSQRPSDYGLLIFDGDAHAAQALQGNPLVAEALRAGRWVLGVDLGEAHKRVGLGDRLGISSRGSSPGYLVRTARDATGHPAVWINEAPTDIGLGAGPASAQPGGDGAGAFAAAVAGQLRGAGPENGRVAPQDNRIPPGLIVKTYYYTPALQSFKFAGPTKHPDYGHRQAAMAQYNFTFQIFLDNENNPQGNFQWVAVNVDATGNPTSGTGTFACGVCYTMGPYPDEWAWFLDRQTVTVRPVDADGGLFTSVGSSPATANNVQTVSTSLSFNVGFNQAQGVTGSFGYSNIQTRSIQDWKLTNNSSGNTFSWYYRSANPLDADQNYWCHGWQDCNPIWGSPTSPWYPSRPNDISMTQLQLHTQGAWKTSSVVNRTVSFLLTGVQGLADVYCPYNFGYLGCMHSNGFGTDWPDFARQDVPYTGQLDINLGSVVPVPIHTITFSPNPVDAGATVTGTITLKGPAPEDIDIPISSNSQNATVLPKVTVKQGETSADFQVLTNANGLDEGESTVATITAFYAQDFQAQLRVKN